ncbi:Trm112 family protein [Gaopeijia maritima]|uniref:Trm112 family protein n=1 Tax=Gaopeijia maritima TaxID=3119007 RepID=A0ABU9E505_9BACT
MSPLDPELLDILVCPETHRPVVLADEPLVARVNRMAGEGSVSNRGGATVQPGLEALLLRDDGRVAYPVREEIPIMLIDESIDIAALPGPADADAPTP